MDVCPRCQHRVDPAAHFCPNCGAQVRVQPLEGQVVETERARNRPRFADPLRAAVLSIIPGLGHWYAGAPLRGAIFFVAILGPEVLGVELDFTVVGAALGVPLEVGGLALWAYCAVDAYRTAARRNASSAKPGRERS